MREAHSLCQHRASERGPGHSRQPGSLDQGHYLSVVAHIEGMRLSHTPASLDLVDSALGGRLWRQSYKYGG